MAITIYETDWFTPTVVYSGSAVLTDANSGAQYDVWTGDYNGERLINPISNTPSDNIAVFGTGSAAPDTYPNNWFAFSGWTGLGDAVPEGVYIDAIYIQITSSANAVFYQYSFEGSNASTSTERDTFLDSSTPVHMSVPNVFTRNSGGSTPVGVILTGSYSDDQKSKNITDNFIIKSKRTESNNITGKRLKFHGGANSPAIKVRYYYANKLKINDGVKLKINNNIKFSIKDDTN